MSVRLKSWSAAFGVSIALWAIILQGGMAVYQSATTGGLSETAMADAAAGLPGEPSVTARF
ncbi:hypothetical protein [Rhizobium sp. Leaf341]|uniref:hypothetical protein n=1 Tax=Rhizobium sp. Leaf341 TaxID=1736344 RepID=UPI0007159364|nr:hypothetical protein [Rhizobium sp. Leaf341]KQR70818.1 hypothetical protein ASG03_04340 [Rhizobium sp. Leaf341]